MTVKRIRRADEDGVYDVMEGDVHLGVVAKTGVAGRDDYPWSWYLADGVDSSGSRATGSTDSLREGVDKVDHYAVRG